jgi:hypothetical protein
MNTISRPVLLICIDTEEEFDWHKPFNSKSTSTKHMKALHSWQEYFEEWGAKPCYVADYPVCDNTDAISQLCDYHHKGTAELGAHCHPWVNPPLNHEINSYNSYPGNLPYETEKAKLTLLTEAISTHLGESPKTYKAGRYGFGRNTGEIITQLGYDVDLSPSPGFDLREDGGPDYRFNSSNISRKTFAHGRTLTTFPLSGGFIGWGGLIKPYAHALAQKMEVLRIPGILAKARFADRIKLSPEGFTSSEHIKITQYLMSLGINVFTWAFHSPSMVPGYTPYVRNDKELSAFKTKFDIYFDYFTNTLNGIFLTPQQLKKELYI